MKHLGLILISILTSFSAVADSGAVAQGSPMSSMVMLLAFLAIFYFMLWRPQNKQAKQHKALIDNLAKGDEVVTNGGMLGVVERLADSFIVLKISEEAEIKLKRSAVSAVMPKGTLKSI